MKKYILSAIAGALAMFIGVVITGNIEKARIENKYEHLDYVSEITRKECFLCSDVREFSGSQHWGEDNVGIVNLNTFELLYLEINRYDDYGNLIEKPAGYMSCSSLKEAEVYVHAFAYPDRGYADVHISGVKYAVNRKCVQSHLCQACLDSLNSLWFADQPPAELAVISFENRTIRPLLNTYSWFSAGNFGVACGFEDDGEIQLLIHYCPVRYASAQL